MGYVFENQKIPAKLRQRHKILLWTLTVMLLVCGSYYAVYLYHVNYILSLTLYIICVMIMTLSVILMCMALYKIKQTVNDRMSETMNMSRLVTHALAFILYLAAWLIFNIIEVITNGGLFYVTWIVISLFGTSSYFFLCLLVWHLGSNNQDQIDFKAVKDAATRSIVSTLSDDFTAKETYKSLRAAPKPLAMLES